MTALAIILACLGVILVIGAQRGQVGRAVTDVSVLVGVFGVMAIVDIVLSRFVDTGNTAWTVAAMIAGAVALDAIYGLMAPQRQQRRDRRIRDLMQRRRA